MKPVKLFDELGCLSWWSFRCMDNISDVMADFQISYYERQIAERVPIGTYFFYQGFCKETLICRCGSAPTPHL